MFSRWELLGKEVEEVPNKQFQTFQRGIEKRYFERDEISPLSQISQWSKTSKLAWQQLLNADVKQEVAGAVEGTEGSDDFLARRRGYCLRIGQINKAKKKTRKPMDGFKAPTWSAGS